MFPRLNKSSIPFTRGIMKHLPAVLLLLSLAALGLGAVNEENFEESSSSRLLGGARASPGAHAHSVHLKAPYGRGCGGVLLSPEWVLTAAWCVDHLEAEPGLVTVCLGSADGKNCGGSGAVVRGAEKIVVNAGYRPVSGRVSPFNLALVKLSVPVKMSGWIKAAGIVEKAPSVGATLTMAAFSEGELREGKQSVVACPNQVGKKGSTFCTTKKSGAQFAYLCPDDEGSFIGWRCRRADGTEWCVTGVAARRSAACNRRETGRLDGDTDRSSTVGPALFTSAGFFKGWIQATMARE